MAYQPKSYRKFLATSVAVAAVATVAAPAGAASSFPDVVPGSYYEEAVNYLTSQDVIKGLPGGIYAPLTNVDRAQFSVILAGALDLELSDNPKRVFPDVNPNSYYGAAVEALFNAGIVDGDQKGNFNPTNSIDRASVAKMVVEAFGFEQDSSVRIPFNDVVAGSWYEGYVNTLYSVGVVNGTTANTFSPQGTVDRAQAAVFVYNALLQAGVDPEEPGDEEAVANVKAINNTTVEVTFEDEVADVKALDFAIEGLTVSNAVVKQTDSKTVVLTTSAQTGGEEYTVTVNNATVGTFEGISAVLPESVSFVNQSTQGIYGQEVTVRAQVAVKEGESKAGIPVTFNIDSDKDVASGSFGKDFVAEAITDADGVATYSYTQYNTVNSKDTVTAYATGKANVRSSAAVYWGNAARLTVTDVTEGNVVANSGTKVYQVTSPENKDGYVAVTFKENVGVTPDKVTNGVHFTDANVYRVNTNNTLTRIVDGVPFEVTTGGQQVALVKLNDKGVGNFTLTGTDASVTPVVYSTSATPSSTTIAKHSATELQATASTVKFEANQTAEVSLVASGVQNSAARNANNGSGDGGREYTVTLRGKDGKVAPAGTTAYIYFDKKSSGNSNNASSNLTVTPVVNGEERAAQPVTPGTNDRLNSSAAVALTVDANGQAKFIVRGNENDYATPIAVYDNGRDALEIDSADAKVSGEIVYFGDAVVGASKLRISSVNTGRVVSTITGNDTARIQYVALDQNGYEYYNDNTRDFDATFTFVDTFTNFNVSGGTLVSSENNRKTYRVKAVNGVATLYVSAVGRGSVDFTASTTNNILTAQNGSIVFNTVADAETLTGTVFSVDRDEDKVSLIIDSEIVELSYEDALLYYKGSAVGVTKSFFEQRLLPGATVAYSKATADAKAMFDIIEDPGAAIDNLVVSEDVNLGDLDVDNLTVTGDNITISGTGTISNLTVQGSGLNLNGVTVGNLITTGSVDAPIESLMISALSEPGDETNEPGDETNEPGDETNEPGDETNEPGDETNEPGDETNEPGDETNEPGDETNEPGDETNEPGDETNEPGDETNEPGDETNEPGDEIQYATVSGSAESLAVTFTSDVTEFELGDSGLVTLGTTATVEKVTLKLSAPAVVNSTVTFTAKVDGEWKTLVATFDGTTWTVAERVEEDSTPE